MSEPTGTGPEEKPHPSDQPRLTPPDLERLGIAALRGPDEAGGPRAVPRRSPTLFAPQELMVPMPRSRSGQGAASSQHDFA
jgi:hypothetical protein